MSQTAPIVVVVDEDDCFRASVEALIRREGWRPRTFASVPTYLAAPRATVPSCLLIDAALPSLDGCARLDHLLRSGGETPVIVTSRSADVSIAVDAMKAGASDFLAKPIRDDALVAAVRRALEYSREALGYEAEVRALREAYASLSRREREVMRLVASGHLNKQVGRELGISEVTVKAHRGHAMRKMGAETLADLVSMALGLQLTPWSPVIQRAHQHPDGAGVNSGPALN